MTSHYQRELRRRCYLPLCLAALCGVLSAANVSSAQKSSPVAAATTEVKTGVAQPPSQADPDTLALGFSLIGEQRHEEAHALFAAFLKKHPRAAQALYGDALALFNLRRVDEAERQARAAVEESLKGEQANAGAKQRAADALVLLGVIVAVRGDNAGALAHVRQAVALAPDHSDAQFALGRALYGAGDPAGASVAFRATMRLRPGDARALFYYATALERAGDDEGALTAYRDLVARQPESADGHLGLGVLLVKLGGARTSAGISELLRAVALNPDLYEARVALGRALIRANRMAEALEHLQRAATLAPHNPEPHYQLTIAYRRLGRTAEAAAESAIVKQIHESRRGARAGRKSEPPAATDN